MLFRPFHRTSLGPPELGMVHQRCGGAPHPPGILCLGDSMTEGVGVVADSTYPALLSKICGCDVVNLGIGGQSSIDGLKRLRRDVLPALRSTVVIQYYGNDLKHGASPQAVERNLRRISRCLRSRDPRIRIYCWDFPGADSSMARENRDFQWISIYPGLNSRDHWDQATGHPSTKGNRAIALAVARIICADRTSQL